MSIDEYTCERIIGQGTFGFVFLALVRGTDEKVAIKKQVNSKASTSFKNEVLALKQIGLHVNVVSLKRQFENNGMKYNVFEYVDFELRDLIEKAWTHIPWSQRKCFCRQLAVGLAFIHQRGVLHGDMKTNNVLINKSGQLKISDFGSALPLWEPRDFSKNEVVTRWYRAPELFKNDLTVRKAIDNWAMGCMFFEILSGQVFLPGASDVDQHSLVTELTADTTKKLISSRGIWSDRAASLIARLLDTDPNKRAAPATILTSRWFTQEQPLCCDSEDADGHQHLPILVL